MNLTTEKLKRLHGIRRLLKGLLPMIDLELSEYNPKCPTCFNNKGLVDVCECSKEPPWMSGYKSG